ncbi:MAG: sporulation protein YtfJ [Clostridia bacterium]|nr:sporulation protein YtfJ [Clostridia bacterium]
MQLNTENNKINKAIETALKNVSALVDANTVIGKPLKTNEGDYIIPVSKITVGVLSGGGEYGKVNIFKKGSDLPYSAGNGAIVSVKPCGFLVKDNGSYRLISVADGAYEKLLDKASDFIVGLKDETND